VLAQPEMENRRSPLV